MSSKVTKENQRDVRGNGGGLSREEMMSFLQKYEQSRAPKPLVLEQMYDPDDARKKALVTETPPRLIPTIIRLRMCQAALDPDRTKPLVDVFIEELDTRMISYQRKGRLELLGALQALSEGGEDQARL